AVNAGLATLRLLKDLDPYSELERRCQVLRDGLLGAAAETGLSIAVNRVGSMFTAFFADGPVTDWSSAKRSDTDLYGRFFRAMLEERIYMAPSQFECAFLGIEHIDEVIDSTVRAGRKVISRMANRT